MSSNPTRNADSESTHLSPRLQHLLIKEDRYGHLILPDRPQPPPVHPPIPSMRTAHIPDLPPPLPDHRRGSDLVRLLNASPPHQSSHISPLRPSTAYPQVPATAPIQRPYEIVRPEIPRRHSAHPYEVNPVTNRIVYKEFDFSPIGSRAPISRTTKACNACRARKVRCDAGGGGQGSEPSTCSRCREAGVECAYSGVQKKRGPCPGTARPTLAQRRRGSQKSLTTDSPPSDPNAPPVPAMTSKSSVQSLTLQTPPDHSPPQTSRSSYGFPPPGSSYTPSAIHSAPADWARQTPVQKDVPPSFETPFDHRHATPWHAHPYHQPPRHHQMFSADYSMGAREQQAVHPQAGNFGQRADRREALDNRYSNSDRSLPPLRLAVDHPYPPSQPLRVAVSGTHFEPNR